MGRRSCHARRGTEGAARMGTSVDQSADQTGEPCCIGRCNRPAGSRCRSLDSWRLRWRGFNPRLRVIISAEGQATLARHRRVGNKASDHRTAWVLSWCPYVWALLPAIYAWAVLPAILAMSHAWMRCSPKDTTKGRRSPHDPGSTHLALFYATTTTTIVLRIISKPK